MRNLGSTVFSATYLDTVQGLETCYHGGPSTLDHRTLAKSGPLPLAFLRGCGLPDALIDYLPSLLNEPFQFYSCFISYASRDQAFAERLYADLQNKGVRCWFAPEDMKIGDRLRPRIDETIRLYDKLLLVLSKTSVASQWVEQEVETALARERQQRTTILFPVRIDNTVMTLETGWPALIRNTRNIGDFRRWKTHDVYQKAFDRLLRDLKAAAVRVTPGFCTTARTTVWCGATPLTARDINEPGYDDIIAFVSNRKPFRAKRMDCRVFIQTRRALPRPSVKPWP